MRITNIGLFVILIWLSTAFASEVPTLDRGYITLDGKPAANFTLKDMNGKTFEFASTRGNWVFLHFWATWCGPCRRELPEVQKLIKTMHASRLKIVLINTAETEDTIFTFLGSIQVDVPTLLDLDGQVTEQYQPRGLPITILIDPEGKQRFAFFGGRPWNSTAYVKFLNALVDTKSSPTK